MDYSEVVLGHKIAREGGMKESEPSVSSPGKPVFFFPRVAEFCRQPRPTCLRAMLATAAIVITTLIVAAPLQAEQLSLQALVTPSTTIVKDGHTVTFALHGFIEFKSLAEMFPYIEAQTRRWRGNDGLDDTGRRDLARELLRRGIESRVISMIDERPLEVLITHTKEELRQSLAGVHEAVPPGYGEAFIAVQEK